jgi:DNA-binding MarR family transcriptional regulator
LITWYRFIRVWRKIFAVMDETMKTIDMSRPQFDLLMQVAFEDGISQQICADRLTVTKSNITQHIDRLEKRGVIKRQKEGRTKFLHLTEVGEQMVANMMPDHDERVKGILSLISGEEFKQFQVILRKLDRGLI